MNTQTILDAANAVLSGTTLNESKFHTWTDHLKPKGKMKEMIDAQTVGKPLVNKDGSEVDDTVYCGDGTYLAKSGNLYSLNIFGRVRTDADDSMSWDKYIGYDHSVTLTADAVKNAAKFLAKA